MIKDYKGLSDIAKDLKSEWKCWEKDTFFNQYQAMIEICKRIENIEDKINGIS